MKKTRTKKAKSPVKCPWCGREDVPFSKSRFLGPHVNPGGLPCVAVGMPEETVRSLASAKKGSKP